MAVQNEEALGGLRAQRNELVGQQSAMLEQALAPTDAPNMPAVLAAPATPETPEALLEPVDVDTATPRRRRTRPCARSCGSSTSAS
jgi:hypothetical protein